MPIALISDIHANLHALEAVLEDVEGAGCDEVICLGDLVGYGGNPEECVERVREVASAVLLGNHDAVAAGTLSDESFNEVARGAIRATRELLSEHSVRFLQSLPMEHVVGDLYLTHAHPVLGDNWAYVFVGEQLDDIFSATDARLMAIGHTHTPGIGSASHPVLQPVPHGPQALDPNERYLINVGSVGQPRDRDPRAAWVRYDGDAGRFELRRVEYDVAGAQLAIRERAFPDFLAERLSKGM